MRPADWDERHADALTLVLTASEALAAGGPALACARSAAGIIVEVAPAPTIEETTYNARRALAAVRGANASARLGILAAPPVLDFLLQAGIAAYVDFAVTEDGTRAAAWKQAYSGLGVWTTVQFDSFERLVDATAAMLPDADGVLIWPPIVPTLALVADLGTFASLFPDRLIESPVDRLQCDPSSACRVRQYERPDTHERVVVVRRTGGAQGRAAIALDAPRADMFAVVSHVGASPRVSDSFLALAPAVADASGVIHLWLPMTGVSHLIARIPPLEQPIAEQVSVVGGRQLTIDEIVARHQAQAARQDALITALVTHARTTATFEVPAFAAPVTVQARTEIIERGGTIEVAQRNITVNGVAFSEKSFPRLPIIEPERVAAPPLAITLTRAYRYHLAGKGTVNGRAAYVVTFEPVTDEATLFEGRAWIDAASFGLLRVDAVQTNLHGPITSSQQIEEFAPERMGDGIVWLLARSDIRQVYQGAGVTTPVHRVMVVDRHEINPVDLDVRLRAAEQEDTLLLRDTGEGLHYADRTRGNRVFTLAGGLLIDPNISDPLPFAGVNYSDFDFLGSGAQFNAFFGGAYGQFAFSLPSIGGTRWQLAGSGFAMLARYNDRAFRAGREQYDENLSQQPGHISAGVLRTLDARTSVRAEYVFDYIALDRSDSTSPRFVVPADQVVHGVRLSLERHQWGWHVVGWWNPARRAGWHAWGFPESAEYHEADRTFQRAGVNASRPWVLGPRLLARVEGAWMLGSDLDRFSRYAFDSFENRLHGYPSASVRYDRGAVLRTALVTQPGWRLRLDGFADIAVVRDRGFGRTYRTYPGLGAALEAPGPVGLLLGAEWGYGFQGLNANSERGTHVVRLTAYKLF
ncbi:MAG: hypothetical protein ACM36C_07480 [Acidobacteriota bacterium]